MINTLLLIISLAAVPYIEPTGVAPIRAYLGDEANMSSRHVLGQTSCFSDEDGNSRACIIELNPCLVTGLVNYDALMVTWLHEVAHYVNFVEDGVVNYEQEAGHDDRWKEIMRGFGLPADAYAKGVTESCAASMVRYSK